MDRPLTILLTGATGYIGARWLQGPSGRVGKVIALVRDLSGEAFSLHAPEHIEVEVRQGSIPSVDPAALLDGVDIVLHFAAQTPQEADSDLVAVNLEWTKRLARSCAQRRIKLLFPSTGSVYSGEDGALYAEDTTEISPWGEYASSKYRAEQALEETPGLSYAIVRLGSVFGYAPRMNTRTAVNAFVDHAARGEAIEVWKGAVDQLRPYTYIDDCVGAINLIIDKDLFNGLVYNVVSENQTVRVILRYIHDHMPQAPITTIESDRMNDLSFGMDDARIRSLGFHPRGTLEAGIAEMFRAREASTPSL